MNDRITDGFLPILELFELTPQHHMLTKDGEIVSGHSVRLRFVGGSDILFCMTSEDLQRLFLLTMKVMA